MIRMSNHISKSFQTKLSEILTFLSDFNNAICGIFDSFVRFLHSDQNVRNAPDQANYHQNVRKAGDQPKNRYIP